MAQQRFPIRFTGANKAMAVLGLRPSNSYIEVGADTIEVRMAYGFSATFPRASVTSVGDDHGRVWGWGVHGRRGTWLVNGSSGGLVRIELDPEARARVLGLPVRLRVLRIAVEDPAALREELATPAPT